MNDGSNFKKFDKAVNADNSHFLYVADICRIVKRSGISDSSNFKKIDKAVTADNSHFFIYSGYMQDSETVGNERR